MFLGKMPNTSVVTVNTKYFAGTTTFKKYPYQVAKFLNVNPETIESGDFLYQEELEAFKEKNLLNRLDLPFFRGGIEEYGCGLMIIDG